MKPPYLSLSRKRQLLAGEEPSPAEETPSLNLFKPSFLLSGDGLLGSLFFPLFGGNGLDVPYLE